MSEEKNTKVCGEATETATIANEIFERFVKVFEDTEFDSMHFEVEIDTSRTYCQIYIEADYDEIAIQFRDCCAEIIGYEEGAEWTYEEVRWDPENYDVDVVYENIKNAVITVYAGIAECRMRYKFDKE